MLQEHRGGKISVYTPNLGFMIAVPGREREQGRFEGSTEGAPRLAREQWGVEGSTGGALGRSKKGEVLAPQKPNL